MYEIDSKLAELENTGSPIQVALIGAGQMGTDIIAQVECMVGMDIPVVCDLSLDLAEKGYRVAGYTGEIVRTNEMDEAIEAVQAGKKVATENYRLAVTLPMVEVVIDATGSPEMALEYLWTVSIMANILL